jgi:hypothetical protein
VNRPPEQREEFEGGSWMMKSAVRSEVFASCESTIDLNLSSLDLHEGIVYDRGN